MTTASWPLFVFWQSIEKPIFVWKIFNWIWLKLKIFICWFVLFSVTSMFKLSVPLYWQFNSKCHYVNILYKNVSWLFFYRVVLIVCVSKHNNDPISISVVLILSLFQNTHHCKMVSGFDIHFIIVLYKILINVYHVVSSYKCITWPFAEFTFSTFDTTPWNYFSK